MSNDGRGWPMRTARLAYTQGATWPTAAHRGTNAEPGEDVMGDANVCRQCGIDIGRKSMERHLKAWCLAIPENRAQCPHCGVQVFTHRLKPHIRNRCLAGDRPLARCDYCGARIDPKNLQKHQVERCPSRSSGSLAALKTLEKDGKKSKKKPKKGRESRRGKNAGGRNNENQRHRDTSGLLKGGRAAWRQGKCFDCGQTFCAEPLRPEPMYARWEEHCKVCPANRKEKGLPIVKKTQDLWARGHREHGDAFRSASRRK